MAGLRFTSSAMGQPRMGPKAATAISAYAAYALADVFTTPEYWVAGTQYGAGEANVLNTLYYSQQFDNAAWNKAGSAVVTANYGIAPDSTTTAERYQTSTGSAGNGNLATIASAASTGTTTRTLSVWMKSNTGGNFTVSMDLTEPSVLNHPIEFIVTPVWQQFTNTQTFSSAASASAASWAVPSSGAGFDILIWQAQIVAGSSAGPTILTLANPATSGVGRLPGYTFTRTGIQGAVDASGAVQFFAANVPAINSAGYHAYGALTNLVLQSQASDDAAWTKDGTTVTANAVVAPDGFTTADTLVATATTAEHRVYQFVANAAYEKSVFAKAGTAGFLGLSMGASGQCATFNLTNGTVSSSTGVTASIVAAANGFYRCCVYDASSNAVVLNIGTTAANAVAGQAWLGAGETVHVWQTQTLGSQFPDGGPIIATAGATASIGASALSQSVANGNYTATYTFDDNSTQAIATTIAAGTFAHPVFGTLNRGKVKQVIFT